MALTFPDSSASPFVAPNGVTYVWNTDGYWEASLDGAYLSKLTDDTAAGAVTFEGLTTHQGGLTARGVQSLMQSDLFLVTSPNAQFRGASTDPNPNCATFALYSKADSTDACAIKVGLGTSNGFDRPSYKGVNIVDIGSNQVGHTRYGVYSDLALNPNAVNYNFFGAGTAPNYFAGNMEFDCPTVFTSTALNHKTKFLSSSTFKAATGVGSNTGQGAFEVMAVNTGSGANNAFVFTDTTGVDRAVTRGSIKITASGTNFNETSDYRLKSNILALPSATNLVKQLNPVSFDINGINRRGFIAHELQAVEPLAVDGVKDETEIVGTYTHADGVIQTEVCEPETIPYGATWEQTGTRDVYQGVDQSKLIPLLTKALQEALDKIETLETRLSDAGIA